MTAKGLDLLSTAMSAIANESVDASLSDSKVQALSVGTGEALGVQASGELPGGSSPRTRGVQEQALSLQLTREWRRDDRRDNRLGSVASGGVGLWSAWPFCLSGKAEDETSPDATAVSERG